MLQRREDEPQERGCGYTEGGIRGRDIRIEGEREEELGGMREGKKREREREASYSKLEKCGEPWSG
jgi:hypothetical protein